MVMDLGTNVDSLAIHAGGPGRPPVLAVGISYTSGMYWTGEVRVFLPGAGEGDIARGPLRAGVPAVGFSGTRILSGGDDGAVDLWEIHMPGDGSPAGELERLDGVEAHDGGVTAVEGKADSSFFASSGDDATICIWDSNQPLTTPLVELAGHTAPIEDLSWSGVDGPLLASASQDCTVRVWDERTAAQGFRLACRAPAYSVAWSTADEAVLAVGDEGGGVSMYDTRQPGEPLAAVRAHGDVVRCVAFSDAPGCCLASASDDGSIRLHPAAAADAVEAEGPRLEPHAEGAYIRALGWGRERELYSGGWDCKVVRTDVAALMTEV